jgi:hypothetical protein
LEAARLMGLARTRARQAAALVEQAPQQPTAKAAGAAAGGVSVAVFKTGITRAPELVASSLCRSAAFEGRFESLAYKGRPPAGVVCSAQQHQGGDGTSRQGTTAGQANP